MTDHTRLIRSDDDLAEGMAHLVKICPVWAHIAPSIGPLPLRSRPDGFEAIANAVVAQQISVAAADSIWARMRLEGLVSPQSIAAADVEMLRAAGLSRPKARYLQGIAGADIDWNALRALPDDDVIAALVALPGVGIWTAEIYLKFALGRPDAFAAGDLAMQEAARMMYGLDRRPGPAALREMARPWSPWRAVAARGLWAYYELAKGREGVR